MQVIDGNDPSPNDDIVEIHVYAHRFQRQKALSHAIITKAAPHIYACFSGPTRGRIEGPRLAETLQDLMTLGYTVRTTTSYQDLTLLDFGALIATRGMKVLN